MQILFGIFQKTFPNILDNYFHRDIIFLELLRSNVIKLQFTQETFINPDFIIDDDISHPYPRICAHRGMCAAAPDNSLPAFGAAIALEVDEIELDVLPTKDGKLISMHDRNLELISDGHGMEYDFTPEQLFRYCQIRHNACT